MMPLSREDIKKLRRAKANELRPGGVFYYRDQKGEYFTVIIDLEYLGMSKDEFKRFIKLCSAFGYLYLNRDYPNYSLEPGLHKRDWLRIQKYQINEVQSKQPDRQSEVQEKS